MASRALMNSASARISSPVELQCVRAALAGTDPDDSFD